MGDLSVADEILATNFVWTNPLIPSELAHGPEAAKKSTRMLNTMTTQLNV